MIPPPTTVAVVRKTGNKPQIVFIKVVVLVWSKGCIRRVLVCWGLIVLRSIMILYCNCSMIMLSNITCKVLVVCTHTIQETNRHSNLTSVRPISHWCHKKESSFDNITCYSMHILQKNRFWIAHFWAKLARVKIKHPGFQIILLKPLQNSYIWYSLSDSHS